MQKKLINSLFGKSSGWWNHNDWFTRINFESSNVCLYVCVLCVLCVCVCVCVCVFAAAWKNQDAENNGILKSGKLGFVFIILNTFLEKIKGFGLLRRIKIIANFFFKSVMKDPFQWMGCFPPKYKHFIEKRGKFRKNKFFNIDQNYCTLRNAKNYQLKFCEERPCWTFTLDD